MPQTVPSHHDEHERVHIDLDEPEFEPDGRERRLNARITALLIVAVVLAVGLLTSTMLYIDQVDEADRLRQQLAEAESRAEVARSGDDLMVAPLVLPEADAIVEFALVSECEDLGWYTPTDPSLAEGDVVEFTLGGTVLHCSDRPQ